MKKFSLWSLSVIFLLMFVVGCGKSTSLEGKVVDGNGQPLANVKVSAKMSQPIKGYEQFETTTGTDGSFKFGKLFPTSEYQVILYSERGSTIKKIKIESGPVGLTSLLPDPVEIRFMDFRQGVVLDTKTNLMWAAEDNRSGINWANAKSYCENYRGGGYTDWRMPTPDELAGLYDESKSRPAACIPRDIHVATEFINITCFAPWASETRGSEAVLFGFSNGGRAWVPQSSDTNTRALPVRSAGIRGT